MPSELKCRSLPIELWTNILHIYCGRFRTPAALYNRLREDLRRKNAGWMRLIDSNPLFWYKVVVDRHALIPRLQQHVANVQSRPIDILIDLDRHSTTSHSQRLCNATLPRYRRARDMLAIVIQTSHLWRQVVISATCVTYMQMILHAIRDAPAPALTQLSLRCHTYSKPEFGHHLFATPPIIFAGYTPRLLKLELVSAALPWDATGMFRSMTSLELTNMPMIKWPTPTAVAVMLTAATSLRTLLFKNFGISELDNPAPEPFCMPSLQKLELIKSKGTDSVLRLLHASDTPSLRQLTLRKFSGTDYLALRWALRSFSTIHELIIRATLCVEIDPEDLVTAFQDLTELRQLDIRRDGLTFLEALAANPTLLPKLEVLHVGDVDLRTVHTFVIHRPNHKNLKISLQFLTDLSSFDNGPDLTMLTNIRRLVSLLDVYPIL
ncbi:hypothetical protein B0H11DRAFT_1919797 [Mycena galericulata]|nr:hypothetical protein B0H11DRAFT_1919797 [Mycena galericulata]